MEIPGKGGSIKKINEKYIYSLLSGKSFKDENFPVASFMINRKLKEFIRHFYFFARTSDDIADHEKLRPKEKLKILSYFDKCLKEKKKTDISVLNKLIITFSCHEFTQVYSRQLLVAFKLDAKKKRYKNWSELINYCKYSANPVGRFFINLAYHERKKKINNKNIIFEGSDNLCTALQIINHLQDCQKDYISLDRVYLPMSYFNKYSIKVDDLKISKNNSKFYDLKKLVINKVEKLLEDSKKGIDLIEIGRLKKETLIILNIAKRLCFLLKENNPLEKNIKLSRIDLIFCFIKGIMSN